MSWLLVFLGLCVLVILHEAGHFAAARATGMRVEKFFLFFGPKLVSVKRGETEYGIAAIPLGGFVKISGMNPTEELPPEVAARAYYRQPVWKRIVVTGAGPAVNIVLAFAIFFLAFYAFGEEPAQKVERIVPGSPAARVLKPGDRIIAVDGRSYSGLDGNARLERFGDAVASHKCPTKQTEGCRAATPVSLTIRRGGRLETVSVRPVYDAGLGRTRVGFAYGGLVPANLSASAALSRSLDYVWFVARETGSVFGQLFKAEKRKEVSSIVGASDVAHQAIDVGPFPALMLLALVSLSLGLINLLPILPLDGGHIFWSLIEKVRGRPVPLRVIERATAVGIVLVVMLAFVGISNDIGRITGEGFHAR
jgi:regulator of sigma E protease